MAKKLFFKTALGTMLLFWHEETEETDPYISLKIPGSFSRFFSQSSSEWLHMEVLYKTKTCSISRRQQGSITASANVIRLTL